MTNTHFSRTFNYINYTILACIFPVGYFAPLGEWLIISVLAISTIIKFLLNRSKVSLDNYYTPLIAILLILISCFYSINPYRSLEALPSAIGMIITIYLVLRISSRDVINNLDNIIGIPIIITSLCLFLDIFFNTEIRSSLALLAGDSPTSESGNFSRGITVLTMVMPISVALFINNKKYLFAIVILILITLIVMFGPNGSSKVALLCSYFTALIVYFLGKKSFFYFGAVSLLWILFSPFIAIKVAPVVKNINYEIKLQPWQETSSGGSIVHRLLVWEYVGNTLLQKPIIGHGIGTSRLIGQNIIFNIPYTNREIKGGIPLHPHNNFLEIWLELGLLGALIISLIWIKIIKFGISIRKNSYILGTGVCTSIVTMFVMCNLTFGAFQAWWMASLGLIFLIIMKASEQINNNRKVI